MDKAAAHQNRRNSERRLQINQSSKEELPRSAWGFSEAHQARQVLNVLLTNQWKLLEMIKRLMTKLILRLIDKEMDQLLLKLGMGKTKLPNNGQADHADENYGKMLKGMDLKEKKLKERNTLLELEPAAAQVLHELVSLVHNSVSSNLDGQLLSTSINDYELAGNDKCEKIVTADLKDDPLAKILWDVEPQTLQL